MFTLDSILRFICSTETGLGLLVSTATVSLQINLKLHLTTPVEPYELRLTQHMALHGLQDILLTGPGLQVKDGVKGV